MKQIFGWADFNSTAIDQTSIDSIIKACFPNQNNQIISKTKDGSAVCKFNPAADKDIHQYEHILIVIDGHAYWSDNNLNKQAQERGLASTIAKKYLELGPSFVKQLLGSFALALINTNSKEVFLAADRLGICPLSYSIVNSSIVFGSNAILINNHNKITSSINPQAIFNYLYFHIVPTPISIYENIVRLLPGEYVLFKQGSAQHEFYWQANYLQKDRSSKEDLTKELFSVLRNSVTCAINGCNNPGAFLSGGIDSSTVAGMLGKVTDKPAKTYSIGFDAEGFDEMEYARIVASHFKTEHHEYYVTPEDVLKAIPAIAKTYDQPYGNASAVPAYYCAQLAQQDGIDRLLAGDGGDELFGGNARYAKQNIFSYYNNVPGFVRKSLIEPVFLQLFSNLKLFPFNKIHSYVQQATTPMPERMETYNLLNRVGITNIFCHDFLTKIDINDPIIQQKKIYDSANADNLIDRMLALDLKFTLADNDLPKVTKMCEMANIDVSFPLLNDHLVEYSGNLPANLKVNGTKLRYFIKQSLDGFLPRATIDKEKHGFGLPFGIWLQNYKPLHEFAFDRLNNFKKRDIINNQFINTLMDTYLPSHPTYYGTLVWIIMMYEEWHQQHMP